MKEMNHYFGANINLVKLAGVFHSEKAGVIKTSEKHPDWVNCRLRRDPDKTGPN